MQLAGKKVLVVGFGKTGFSTTRFLLDRGAVVTLTDMQHRIDVPREFLERGVKVEAGGHRIETFTHQDCIVVSPGVPLMQRPIIEARSRGIEVISEIELASRFLRVPLIAVTGTNGKTTTTSLIGSMLARAGKRVFVGGNIGTPLIDVVREQDAFDYIVAEISSFQLEAIEQFRPDVSVLLNITDDHLDRHPTFHEYVQAKSNIFKNQRDQDVTILNYDDPNVRDLAHQARSRVVFFSTAAVLDEGVFWNGYAHIRIPGVLESAFSLEGARLQGAHNRENMLAAVTVGVVCGVDPDTIRTAVIEFQGLPHRMEFVAEVNGVTFYNDSKGTNVGACVRSLESLDPPIILIAGGKDKGGSYRPLRELVAEKVKALIVLGEAQERIVAELGSLVPTFRVATLEEAVRHAYSLAAAGDRVLLSPACASFDMFRSYEHRGRCFCEAVHKLKNAIQP
ncbi:MAG: UDP-N-acetylmuramoyl-L-alanine--D-glutamate ligase [Desulfobacterota bacterium]|nr:UDP-N-acetylmuramoyl-L-alanine--D-glutamate ligase [Thermodesulfobacteriota bacterium]